MFGLLIIFSVSIQAETNGEQLYLQNCMVCHADDGSGAMPGVIDLVKNNSWSTISTTLLLDRLKQDIQTPGTTVMMPPKGGNPDLSDKDILSIIFFMRKIFKLANLSINIQMRN